jgi:hypothetical protein
LASREVRYVNSHNADNRRTARIEEIRTKINIGKEIRKETREKETNAGRLKRVRKRRKEGRKKERKNGEKEQRMS